eukprot:TRINITY_DN1981_c0_g1_i1.p1 TRINITY_DN1981_c0_g1~~TRINITY_DN1981_c0_g1_i1.p1  ORF type:complete len:237 (+),score=42.34 TRINITY_DN1981_c0_g1_i1:1457-2167(+)
MRHDFQTSERNSDSLKRKLSSLHRQTVPTGDPTIPPDVKRAKAIREQIRQRADLGDGAETDVDVNESIPEFIIPAGDCGEDINRSYRNPDIDEDAEVQRQEGSHGGTTEIVDLGPSPSRSITPRPLVQKRNQCRSASRKEGEGQEQYLMEMYRLNMLQEQSRREDEYRLRMLQREEDRERREEERCERKIERQEEKKRRESDRERAEEDARRQNQFMQMMMMALFKGQVGESLNKE